MTQRLNPDDLSWVLVDWGNWKTCRPRDRLYYDGEKVWTPTEFASKPPKGVWMTPRFTVVNYLYISEAYQRLPDVQHRVIKRVYVDQVPEDNLPKVLGIRPRAIAGYRLQAYQMIADWVNLQAEAYASDAA